MVKELVVEPTWITDDHVMYQSTRGTLRMHSASDIRTILECLADREHITCDMDDWAIDTWLEACDYGVWRSLTAFTKSYGDDHHHTVRTWSDCLNRGFETIKIKAGYWVFRSDVPGEAA